MKYTGNSPSLKVYEKMLLEKAKKFPKSYGDYIKNGKVNLDPGGAWERSSKSKDPNTFRKFSL